PGGVGHGRRYFRAQALRQDSRLHERILRLGKRGRPGYRRRDLGPLADLRADALGAGGNVFSLGNFLQPARQALGAAENRLTAFTSNAPPAKRSLRSCARRGARDAVESLNNRPRSFQSIRRLQTPESPTRAGCLPTRRSPDRTRSLPGWRASA